MLLGGAFCRTVQNVLSNSAAFIDGSSHGHGVVNIFVTKPLNNQLICQNRQQIAFKVYYEPRFIFDFLAQNNL